MPLIGQSGFLMFPPLKRGLNPIAHVGASKAFKIYSLGFSGFGRASDGVDNLGDPVPILEGRCLGIDLALLNDG